MKSYVFAVSNGPVMVASASIEAMTENCEEYFAVALDGDDELRTLMGLLIRWQVASCSARLRELHSRLGQMNVRWVDCGHSATAVDT